MFDRSSVARHSREYPGRRWYAAGVILAAAISMTQPGGGSAQGAPAGNPAPANPSAPPIVSPMAPEGPRHHNPASPNIQSCEEARAAARWSAMPCENEPSPGAAPPPVHRTISPPG
jgi:hypothetical protein